MLEKYAVDLVFNSHSVVYERSYPIRNNAIVDPSASASGGGDDDGDGAGQGIVYIVAGARERPDWFHPRRAWHTAHSLATPHFVNVAVGGGRIEIKAIDQDGRVFDSHVLYK